MRRSHAPTSPNRPRLSHFGLVVVFLGLSVLAATFGSCSGGEPEPQTGAADGNSDKPPELTGRKVNLRPGDADRFGPLPKKVLDWPVTRGAAPGYVPDRACRECHEQIYDSYQAMGMARSFYLPDLDNLVEDLDKPFLQKSTGRHYVMYVRDGKLFQKRYLLDGKGNQYAVFELPVTWIIGSGNHVRTYLSRTELGEVIELPVSWYTGKGFEMSPGYEAVHSRFERVVGRDCIFCHNAHPEVPLGSDLDHLPALFPKNLPHGIGCQRCHGPGARHVQRAANEESEAEAIREAIVNPGRFSPQKKGEVCSTCHLQPDSRANFQPVRGTKPIYSHVPGDEITSLWVHLDHGSKAERQDRIQVNHHDWRMRLSACFTKSDDKLTCVTCHDPHRKVPKAEQAAHYRKKCFSCHKLDDCQVESMGEGVDASSADCVSCHMLTAVPSDVVHTKITDHWIRRSAPAKDPAAPMAERYVPLRNLQLRPVFAERLKDDPELPVFKGYTQVSYEVTPEELTRWQAAFKATRPHTLGSYVWHGRGLVKNGAVPQAIEVMAEAVKLFPKEPEALRGLGEALWEANQIEGAIAQLEAAKALAPQDPWIARALADAYSKGEFWQKARGSYELAASLRPVNWRTWRHLGNCLERLGDAKAAERAFQQAVRLNPEDAYSFNALARAFEAQGKFTDMYRVLEQAACHLVAMRFELVAKSLLCVDPRWRRPKVGAKLAADLARQAPGNKRGLLMVAMAEAINGTPKSVATALQRARKAGADESCCVGIEVVHLLEQGDRAAAKRLLGQFRKHLQQPSDEPLRDAIYLHLRSRIR